MLFPTIAVFLLSTPLFANAFPQYGKRLSEPRTENTGKYPILRRGAAPYSPEFPYTGAKLDGQAVTGKGGVQVPAPGDTAHYYQDPPPGAQRGPCPPLNTLANLGFISRDGITTYTELTAALQNVYNADLPTSLILTMLGFVLDGDPVSEMISIGGPAQTGEYGNFTGNYGGLNQHGTFELDVSLTRSDFFLTGDSHSFNGTLFGMMLETAKSTSSAANPVENPWLNFPQLAARLHNYGAATFLYEAFPSSAKNNTPDLETISSFFGAVAQPNGTWAHVGERPPANWHNRVTPMTLADVTDGIDAMFLAYPKEFGGNVNGVWVPAPNTTAASSSSQASSRRKRQSQNSQGDVGLICALYSQIIASAYSGPQPYAMLDFILSKAGPVFAPYNCTGIPTLPS